MPFLLCDGFAAVIKAVHVVTGVGAGEPVRVKQRSGSAACPTISGTLSCPFSEPGCSLP